MKRLNTCLINNKVIQNNQRYSECQLVSALNAASWLESIESYPSNVEYEKLVDLCMAREGAAITIVSAYKQLNLEYFDVQPIWNNILLYVRKHNWPIGVNIESKQYGFHNVLIIQTKYEDHCWWVQVPNLNFHTDDDMWIRWNDFSQLITKLPNIQPQCGLFRVFVKESFYLKGEDYVHDCRDSEEGKSLDGSG